MRRTGYMLAVILIIGLTIGNPVTSAPSGPKVLTVVQGIHPEGLDPHLHTTQAALNASTHIFDSLVIQDYKQNKMVGVLATDWRRVNDRTWQFRLRRGVRFTNGEEFDAATVKYNVERVLNPDTKATIKVYLDSINRAVIVDKYTVNIITNDPDPLLLLGLTTLFMVPRVHGAKVGVTGLTREPIGTGPYKFVEEVRDERIVLAANPDYWGGKPGLDRVVFRAAPEASTRMAALRAGEADIIAQVNITDVPALKSGSTYVASVPSLRAIYIILDQTRPGPLQSAKVRQALNHAVDKDAIVFNILQSFGVKLSGQVLTPGYVGFQREIKAYAYDPEKARRLLAEAGYPQGFRLTLWSPRGRYVMDKEIAETVTGQLAMVGVQVDLQIREWGTFITDVRRRALSNMLLMGFVTPPDASFMYSLHTTNGPYTYRTVPEFDAIVRQMRQVVDETQRRELLKRATTMMYEDPPVIFLHQQVDLYGVNKRVRGFVPRPDDRLLLTRVTVE